MKKSLEEIRIEQLEKQVKDLQKKLEYVESNYSFDCSDIDERVVNCLVSSKLAREDEINNKRASEDEDYAYELRCIRYLEGDF